MLGTTIKNEVSKLLGPRIAALRKAAGLNQQTLAARLGVSASAIGMYEQGRREPSAQTLVAMAEVFGVSTDFLLTGRSQTPRETQILSTLILDRVTSADRRLEGRPDRPFSRQELAVLMAAILMESG